MRQAVQRFALALLIIGCGAFKPNISTMVGELYAKGDRRRDAGFTIFYMGINTGSILGQFLCAAFADSIGWPAGLDVGDLGTGRGVVARYRCAVSSRGHGETRGRRHAQRAQADGGADRATFAALAAEGEAVDRLVLLAPVTTGRAYLREMRLRAQTIGQWSPCLLCPAEEICHTLPTNTRGDPLAMPHDHQRPVILARFGQRLQLFCGGHRLLIDRENNIPRLQAQLGCGRIGGDIGNRHVAILLDIHPANTFRTSWTRC